MKILLPASPVKAEELRSLLIRIASGKGKGFPKSSACCNVCKQVNSSIDPFNALTKYNWTSQHSCLLNRINEKRNTRTGIYIISIWEYGLETGTKLGPTIAIRDLKNSYYLLYTPKHWNSQTLEL